MKFAKGQRVSIPAMDGAVGEVLHAFVVKVYAQPDRAHYNVRVGKDVFELDEGELT